MLAPSHPSTRLPASSESDRIIAMLELNHVEHIHDLRSQVEAQQHLIQVLSDSKFFAPRIIKPDPTTTSEPYRPQFSPRSLNDVEPFDQESDAEQVNAQNALAEELEREFLSLKAEQEGE